MSRYTNLDDEASHGPLTRLIDSLDKEYTVSIPGVIFDPEEARTESYLEDAAMCGGMLHRSTLTGVLRFFLPLVATCYNAYSYAICCPAYQPYVFVLACMLALHVLIGAYPLLCCGKPAFDLIDIFVDCFRESSALVLRGVRACFNMVVAPVTATSAPKPSSANATSEASSGPPVAWMAAAVCAPLKLCCGPCGKCFSRLWEFAFSLPLWSVVILGVAVLLVDGSFLFTARPHGRYGRLSRPSTTHGASAETAKPHRPQEEAS